MIHLPEYQIFEFLNAGSPSESLKGGYILKCMYVLKSLYILAQKP